VLKCIPDEIFGEIELEMEVSKIVEDFCDDRLAKERKISYICRVYFSTLGIRPESFFSNVHFSATAAGLEIYLIILCPISYETAIE
jgi:hypothetical protein